MFNEELLISCSYSDINTEYQPTLLRVYDRKISIYLGFPNSNDSSIDGLSLKQLVEYLS